MLQTVCKILSAFLILALLVSCGNSAAESSSFTSSEVSEVVSEVTSEVVSDVTEEKEKNLKEKDFFQINPAPDKKTGNVKRNGETALKNVLIENNLTFTNRNISSEAEHYNYYYFVIDGLKNEKIEKAINDRIYSVYQKIKSSEFIPPYRGIKTKKITNNPQKSISCKKYFNCNNLLSIEFNACYEYSGYENFYYSYSIPITFDLSTGKELTLADLFYENTDYIKLINTYVDNEILKKNYDSGFEEGSMEYYNDEGTYGIGSAYMVAPFKTIKPDQKFYINTNGDIVLITDYNTPEFFSGFDLDYITLNDIFDNTAITDISTGKIFENDDTVYNLRYKYYDETSEDEALKSNNRFSRSYYYNHQMPKETVNAIKEIAFNEKYTPDSIKELYGKYSEDSIFVYYSVSYNCIGDYICVTQDASAYIEEGAIEGVESSRYYCFKKNTATPMKVSDFFVKGFDYESVLKKSFTDYLSHNDDFGDDPEILVKHINGINLQDNGMYFSFDNRYYPIFVSYRDIGCENLTIFD